MADHGLGGRPLNAEPIGQHQFAPTTQPQLLSEPIRCDTDLHKAVALEVLLWEGVAGLVWLASGGGGGLNRAPKIWGGGLGKGLN